jgi:hypothetical protein
MLGFRATVQFSDQVSVCSENDILVHWFGDEDLGPRNIPKEMTPCRYYVQIGIAEGVYPKSVASPTDARIIITSLSEYYARVRVRKALSYEAITVDILRHLRGRKEKPNFEEFPFAGLFGLPCNSPEPTQPKFIFASPTQ